MTGTPPAIRMGRLPLTDWPTADAAVWTAACNPLPGPFSQTRKRSPATYRMYAQGYAGFFCGISIAKVISTPPKHRRSG